MGPLNFKTGRLSVVGHVLIAIDCGEMGDEEIAPVAVAFDIVTLG